MTRYAADLKECCGCNSQIITYVGTTGAISDLWLAGGDSSWWSSFSNIVFSAVFMRLLAIATTSLYFVDFFVVNLKSSDEKGET